MVIRGRRGAIEPATPVPIPMATVATLAALVGLASGAWAQAPEPAAPPAIATATIEAPESHEPREEKPPASEGIAEPAPPPIPLDLEEAIRQSLANVQTIQANVAVRTAAVARFEALKEFVPLVNLPQLAVAFNQLGGPGTVMIMPDVTGGALLEGSPGLQQAALNRANLYFPLAPSGHITALPIAEEGVHAKVLMEQLVRRSQMMLAIQGYYQAKQIDHGLRTARLGVELANELMALTRRKLAQNQAHDVELTEAGVGRDKANVLLTELEKESRVTQRELALVLHRSLLLSPRQASPIPIRMDYSYGFNLDDPDEVDLRWMPDFPGSRDEAIALAKQQRVDVRLRVVGLRIARLQQKRSLLGLLGEGRLPAELGFKNTNPNRNGGITLGAIFGSTYGMPVVDIGLWSSVREARLDVIQSQLELEAALVEVTVDAGNSWDRWRQSVREWELSEAELKLQHELLERIERMYEQKQAIWVEALGARVNVLRADANRWTRWYNLQLARFNVLRSTEQLLDYVERKQITRFTDGQEPLSEDAEKRDHWIPWLTSRKSGGESPAAEGGTHARR